MINWKVRFKNKMWVIALVSQLIILAEVLLIGAHAAGVTDFSITQEMKDWVLILINAVFGVLSTLGVVQDPTTEAFQDSERAKNYNEPK